MIESLLLGSFSLLLLLLMKVVGSMVGFVSPAVAGAAKKLPKSSSSSFTLFWPLPSVVEEGPSSKLSPNKSIVLTAEDDEDAAVVEVVDAAEAADAATLVVVAAVSEFALTCAILSGLLGEMASFCLRLAEAVAVLGGGRTTGDAGVEGFEFFRPNITSSRPE